MSEDRLAAPRRIGTTQFATPLVVPSYSSRGFNPIRPKFDLMSPRTTSASLVSAYDIFHQLLPIDAAYSSDLVILDSGGYEAYASSELSTPAEWSLDSYRHLLSRLDRRTEIVPVTFDFGTPQTVQTQFDGAARLMGDYPQFQWDCLLKPQPSKPGRVDVDAILEMLPSAPRFAILGLTERELGSSIMERARNIARVRAGLSELPHDPPLHVFGCLDPDLMRFYLLAGADVFDGLQWLRHVVSDHGLVRMQSLIVREARWSLDEETVEGYYWVRNLQALLSLQRSLREYSESGDLQAFGLSGPDFGSLVRFSEELEGVGGSVRN